VLRRLVTGSATRNGRLGTIITVLSGGGGCGATTLAINLADELEALTTQPPLIIDLDQHHGSVSGYLGLKAEYGIADVLSDDSRIDGQLVRSTAVRFDERLHVLASPATVNGEAPAPISFDNLGRLLRACRETYAFTIVDAPRIPIEAAAVLVRGSAATFLPFELNVEDIRLTRVLHRSLLHRNVPADRIHPLANRYRSKHQMISLDEARQAIGSTNLDHLSNDYKVAVTSINLGKTLSQFAPRSSLRTEIKALAERVRNEAAQKDVAHAE
jgi:pilus assembly protein CpaE